jgi:quercetin dioxygenase-like cupin family protein
MNVYTDERGSIFDVAEGDFKAIQVITSKKGSIRSNHYHKVGGHILFVVSGRMRYLEAPVGVGEVKETIVEQGQSIFTGPMMVHATEFLEDTVLVCGATVSRADGAYEGDLVRVELL